MKGLGTDEDIIARVIGGSDKATVRKIHKRYDEKYSRSLTEDLKSEVGGNLQAAVIKWIEAAHSTLSSKPAAPKRDYMTGAAP